METNQERTEESTRLMTWALTNFKNIKLFDQNQNVMNAKVAMGDAENIAITVKDAIKITVPTSLSKPYDVKVVTKSPLIAPIKAGDEIGTLRVTIKGDIAEVKEYPLFAAEDVIEAGFIDQFIAKTKLLIFGRL